MREAAFVESIELDQISNALASTVCFVFYSLFHDLSLSSSVIGRMTRHGFPAATTFEGIYLTTTEPPPITTFEPMVTPGITCTPALCLPLIFTGLVFLNKCYCLAKLFLLYLQKYYIVNMQIIKPKIIFIIAFKSNEKRNCYYQ